MGVPHRELPRLRPRRLPSDVAQAFMGPLLKPASEFGGRDSKFSPEGKAHMRLVSKATHGCHCCKGIAIALDFKPESGPSYATLENVSMHSHASRRVE